MMTQFCLEINKAKANQEIESRIYRINPTTNAIPQRPKLSEKQKKELLNEFLMANTPQDVYRPLGDSQEGKFDENSLRIPYMRIRKNNKSPGSKTYIYNTEDFNEGNNRFSETRAEYNRSFFNNSENEANLAPIGLNRPATQLKIKNNPSKLKGIVKGVISQNKRRLTAKSSFFPQGIEFKQLKQ